LVNTSPSQGEEFGFDPRWRYQTENKALTDINEALKSAFKRLKSQKHLKISFATSLPASNFQTLVMLAMAAHWVHCESAV
jgi:regulatory protein YycH of two-component signal transduction system YycFG